MKIYKLKSVPSDWVGLHRCTLTEFDPDNVKLLIPPDIDFSHLAVYDNPESGFNVWFLSLELPVKEFDIEEIIELP